MSNRIVFMLVIVAVGVTMGIRMALAVALGWFLTVWLLGQETYEDKEEFLWNGETKESRTPPEHKAGLPSLPS